MSARLAFVLVTVPTGSSPGAAAVCSSMGSQRMIPYVGTAADDIEFQITADGTNYQPAFRQVANASGKFVILTDFVFQKVRAVRKGGAGGGICGVTAPALAAAVPYTSLTVENDTTPGAAGDTRLLGGPRTYVYNGAAGDQVLIEGSDNGTTGWFEITTQTVQTGKTGFVLLDKKIPNYTRVTRLKGTTTATMAVCALPASSAGSTGPVNVSVLLVADTAVDGPIGGLTAAQTVDLYGGAVLTQTTASVTPTLPAPTDTTPGKLFWVGADPASLPVTMYGSTLSPGTQACFEWLGTAWAPTNTISQGGNAFGVPMVIGTKDSQSVSLQTVGITRIAMTGASGLINITPGASGEVRFLPRGSGAGDTAALAFYGLTGSTAARIKAPDAYTTAATYVLPLGDAAVPGQPLTSAGGQLSWYQGSAITPTTTFSAFTQPAVGSDVNVAVASSAAASVGQTVYVPGGGQYVVTVIPDGTHLRMKNLNSTNTAPAATVAAGTLVLMPNGAATLDIASGSVTIARTSITADAEIKTQRYLGGAAVAGGVLNVSISAGVGFTIQSTQAVDGARVTWQVVRD